MTNLIADETGGLEETAAVLLRRHLVTIPHFPTDDVTYIDCYRTVDSVPEVKAAVVECLVERYSRMDLDGIVGVATGGISVGSCLALALRVPFHPLRKASDTVHDAAVSRFGMVYAERELTLARGLVGPSDRVVVFDDVVATGASVKAGLDLVADEGAAIVEVAALFEVTPRGGRSALGDTPLHSIVQIGSLT